MKNSHLSRWLFLLLRCLGFRSLGIFLLKLVYFGCKIILSCLSADVGIYLTRQKREENKMGRGSIKENKNAYFLAREELGLTRDEAEDLLQGLSADRIERIENERMEPHPYDVLAMAQGYKKPSLCNYYCSHDCPIGKQYVPEVQTKELSSIVLQMLASLNSINQQKDRLIEIAVDGKISGDEIDDFIYIQDELERISITVETLQLWTEKMLANGVINAEAYNARKNK